jgi:hypothetical protein
MGADIVGCLGFGESFGLLELGAVSLLIYPLEQLQLTLNSVRNT